MGEADNVNCGICGEICKRGVKVECCSAIGCRACATKFVTRDKKCWNSGCETATTTKELVNDDTLRGRVDAFLAKKKAGEEASKNKVEEEDAAKKKAEENKIKAEEEKKKAEEERKKKAEEERKKKAEEERKKKAEEESKKKAEEENKKKAEEERKKKVEEERKKKAEEDRLKKAEDERKRIEANKKQAEEKSKAEEKRKSLENANSNSPVKKFKESEDQDNGGLAKVTLVEMYQRNEEFDQKLTEAERKSNELRYGAQLELLFNFTERKARCRICQQELSGDFVVLKHIQMKHKVVYNNIKTVLGAPNLNGLNLCLHKAIKAEFMFAQKDIFPCPVEY